MNINMKTLLLKDIGKVCMCKRVLKEQTLEYGIIPFYKISTFGGKADTYISEGLYQDLRKKYSFPKNGDILISAAGTIGKTVIYNGESGYFQDSNIVWIDNNEKNVTNSYLYYFYQTKPWISTNGSTIKRIYNENLRSIKITFPKSIITQQKIAAVLSALDDKIELNNKINAELEAMAKTLYDYWFVQFDFPDANGKPYKSSGGKMIYNEELKRKIPEGWEVKSLGDLIKTDKSGDWGKEESEGNYVTKVECVRGTDINGINGQGEVKSPVRFILEKNEHKILSNLDLVVEISGGSPTQSTGRLAYIINEVIERFHNPLICSNFCKAISLKEESYFFYFIYTWRMAYDHGVFFGYEGKTSGIKNLLFDTLVSNFKIPLPKKELLESFQSKTSLFEKQRQKNLKQNQELATLRDWLLPMLMNGQVSVGKVYEKVEEVLSVAAEDGVSYEN